MQWIRENLFLTCVTGALIVCLGVAYTIKSAQDAAFAKDMRPRKARASKLRALSSSDSISPEWLKKAKNRLEKIRGQRNKIVRDADNWNRNDYPVLELKVTTGGVTKVLPAFPYDSDVYQEKSLTLTFTNAYRVELYSALAKLDLTSWPTDVEIGERSLEIEKNIKSNRKAAVRRVEYARTRSPDPTPKPPAGADAPPEKKPKGVTQEDWDFYTLTDADVSKRARGNATEELMLQKANAAIMYVTPETLAMVSDPKLPGGNAGPVELDVIFPKDVWKSADAPAVKLWEAQLNLWVTKDILTAIEKTNQQSLRTGGSVRIRKATVPNAAIKLLGEIDIGEQYLMKKNAADGGNPETDLTRRVTTKDYEIIDYRIRLVMTTSYLPSLIQNLMMRGDHTITDVKIVKLPTETAGLQYYGTDPVATVWVSADVLFRSNWTRKIMPSETLKTLPASVPGPGDKKPLKPKHQ